MALVYGVLGVIVITTASTFGTINASRVVQPVDRPRLCGPRAGNVRRPHNRLLPVCRSGGRHCVGKGSVALAFGMGAIAALLAGACVAEPLSFRSSCSPAISTPQARLWRFALPFLLGVGMAVPWPLAGAGLTALPKPGPWMVRVKQAFGVFILATATYYGYLAYGLFADRWVDPKEVAASVEEKLKSGWHSSLAEGLNVALLEQKPVLIDMWATWCKNCVVMDRTTLADPVVTKALDRYVKIKYQAEQLDEYPARALVERFKVVGLRPTSSCTRIARPISRPSDRPDAPTRSLRIGNIHDTSRK